ncbi:hypothetical protein CAC42_2794 [Sphaceloma murrayae]|uniref:Uncharacterized protein n=1 Tax=Sphaceloma murrayae TaxID=2082308 RepID=A0A2K1R115_9PEZI|nr:hypothetical protein CAC42_2794 [Sphaceloma murrayae]
MTARTEVLEKANATSSAPSSQSAKRHSLSPNNTRNTAPRVTRSTSNHSSHSSNGSLTLEKHSNVRATWTGKMLLITGLHASQFPAGPPSTKSIANGTYATRKATRGSKPGLVEGLSPSKIARVSLKRKRSGTSASLNDVYGDSRAASECDESRGPSRLNSVQGDSQSEGEEGEENGERQVDDDYVNGRGNQHAPATKGSGAGAPTQEVPKPKRRRRGQRLLEQAAEASRAPSPQRPLVSEAEDQLEDVDLPFAFLATSPTPDPDEPDDEAARIYKDLYEPLTKAEAFIAALTKINPAQRRTDNLYEIAANTAAALRIWQDEYLEIDRLTAPHAPIPRKPATGNRQLIDPYLFEDQKEAEIYDYTFDAKKVGHQNPIMQKVVRDASGRELRVRGPKTRITADNQLVNAANGISEDDNGRRHRARRPVSKYDGVITEQEGQRRKRGIGQVSDSVENDAIKRGRWSNGRGGRGRGRGGRGGVSRLLDKRVREMREESIGTAFSGSAEDESGSEVNGNETYSREGSSAPEQRGQDDPSSQPDDGFEPNGDYRKKGRPKGSKNLHFRSDKGIPKGPRQPKPSAPNPDVVSPSISTEQPAVDGSAESTTITTGAPTKQTRPGQKPPKSEKRSESMTIWWAKRKAAAAEQRRKEAEAAGLPPPVEKPRSRAPRGDKSQAAKVVAPAATRQPPASSPMSQPPPPPATYVQQRYSNGPSPSQAPAPLAQQATHLQHMPQHHAPYSQPPPYHQPLPAMQYHTQAPPPPSILSDPRRAPAGSPSAPSHFPTGVQDRLPSFHELPGQRLGPSMFREPMPRDPRDQFPPRDRYDPTRPYDRRHEPPPPPPPPPHSYQHPGHSTHTHPSYQQMQAAYLGYPPPPPGLHMQQGQQGYRPLPGQQVPPRDGRDGRRF